MIRHIVFLNLRPELEHADRDWLFGQIQGLSRISSVRRFSLGKLLEAREEWYKSRISTEFGWSFSMDFDDEDGLYLYQHDPNHVAVAQEIRKRVTNIKIVDFDSPVT